MPQQRQTYNGAEYEQQADGTWLRVGAAPQPEGQVFTLPESPEDQREAARQADRDAATDRERAADNARADRSLALQESRAGVNGGRVMPQSVATRHEDAVNSFAAYARAIGGFQDDYAGNSWTGDLENRAQSVFGTGTPGQAQWWADFRTTDNQIRNALFGATLTPSEQTAYAQTSISPRMTPEEVRANLTRRHELARDVLTRRTEYLVANGYNPEAVDALAGEYAGLFNGTQNTAEEGGATGQPVLTPQQQQIYDAVISANPTATADQLRTIFSAAQFPEIENLDEMVAARDQGAGIAPASNAVRVEEPETYQDSYMGQAMSGINEGIGSTLGAPIDLLTGIMNLVPRGINAVANTDIPSIENPFGGGQWFRDRMDGWAIGDTSDDPSKQFTRRVGQSVGSAVVPAGAMTTPGRVLAMLASGAGGGVGAATAQQIAPDNALAEFAGEMIGGGVTGTTLARISRNAEQRAIESAIPTTEQLRDQAGNLYRQAEQRGATADPTLTTRLRDDMQATLRSEGQLGPSGRITDADNNTTRAYNLIDQYAGQPMRPTEMDTVRGVIADGRRSIDPSDQRLASILLDQFDDWARPLVPGFDDARDVSSRYLQAEDLEEARRVAGANASQFSGSGFENALRTQYRGLDRNIARGRDWFTPDTQAAIETVNRGTTGSNIARGIGRFAPTGVVSGTLGMGGPAALGMGMTGDLTGAGLGLATGGAGAIGRQIATNMGIRNADIAELTARNGGAIPQAQMLTPEVQRQVALLMSLQLPKYLSDDPESY